MRALIVDDSRFARVMLRGFLEGEEIACKVASDGQSALTRARDAKADEYIMKPFDPGALNEKLVMLALSEARR